MIRLSNSSQRAEFGIAASFICCCELPPVLLLIVTGNRCHAAAGVVAVL